DAFVAAADAENSAELPGFEAGVCGNGLHFVVKDVNHPSIPPGPDASADILRRNLVVGAFDFDIAVAVDVASAFLEAWEETGWKRSQGRSFRFEEVGLDLAFRGAVYAQVGDVGHPPAQVLVQGGEAVEAFAFKRIVFDVFD